MIFEPCPTPPGVKGLETRDDVRSRRITYNIYNIPKNNRLHVSVSNPVNSFIYVAIGLPKDKRVNGIGNAHSFIYVAIGLPRCVALVPCLT